MGKVKRILEIAAVLLICAFFGACVSGCGTTDRSRTYDDSRWWVPARPMPDRSDWRSPFDIL
ncbi:hypothetical protein [Desulfatiglans anilini]|uniref:hypothetical protein n=1 Tax=Desulfatiglans anilini TaxID=90728 RepID=UPI000486F188|nr:hypothetical protein [Desulfatiglans anilini]